MAEPSRMPNYDVRNDGIGPYAVFYCETCSREYRSRPDATATVAKDLGRKAMGGLLRNIPLVGNVVADSAEGEDPRYTLSLTSEKLDKAWEQVRHQFRECPTCLRIVCLSDWDEQAGYCTEDTPRRQEIAEAEAEQAGAMLKGFANAFGLGGVMKQASQAGLRPLCQGRHCGSGRHQVLPRVRRPHDPACCGRGDLPELRRPGRQCQVLPGMRRQG